MGITRFLGRKGFAAALAALLAVAPQAASASGAAPTRMQATRFVVQALNLGRSAPIPYVDAPVAAADRAALGRAVAAGLPSGLPSVTRRFLPGAPATPLFLAVLAANALPGAHPPGRGTARLLRALRTQRWSTRAATDATWAVGLGLLPSLPPADWTRPVASGAYVLFSAALDHQIAARRPVAVRLAPTVRNVGTDVLDGLRLIILGLRGRPVGLLAGEAVVYGVAGPARASAGVSPGGQFLAATAGLYHVQAVLESDFAPRRIESPPVAIGVFARAVALAIHLSSPSVVADGQDAVSVVVEAIDHRGDAVIRPCTGEFTLAVGGGLRIQDPRDGSFSLRRLRLACTAGEAHFLVAAARGSDGAEALLRARAVAVEGLPATASAQARLEIAMPRAAAVTLARPAGPGTAVVAQGGRFSTTLTVLDQAGVAMTAGTYTVRVEAPAGVSLAGPAPAAYDGAAEPAGMPLTFAIASNAPVGPATVRVVVPGVGAAFVTLRVAPAATSASALHLAGALLAPVVPIAAIEASTAADPADSANLQVLSGAGVPSPYGGSLEVSISLGGQSVEPSGMTVALTPGATAGAYTLLVYGGSGTLAPGAYTLDIAPAPGSPPIRPIALRLTVVAPPH